MNDYYNTYNPIYLLKSCDTDNPMVETIRESAFYKGLVEILAKNFCDFCDHVHFRQVKYKLNSKVKNVRNSQSVWNLPTRSPMPTHNGAAWRYLIYALSAALLRQEVYSLTVKLTTPNWYFQLLVTGEMSCHIFTLPLYWFTVAFSIWLTITYYSTRQYLGGHNIAEFGVPI